MGKKSISLRFDSELLELIEKRAEKNLLSKEELIEDIVRRSMLSYKDKSKTIQGKTDDPLVNVFSRDRRGRKKK